MKLVSPAFANGKPIPEKYTCDGENVNPPLEISQVPSSATSLVLIVEDPDVLLSIRDDGIWDHWLVWDLPPETKNILEDSAPLGIVGVNTQGRNSYGGPCPPNGEHRYFFKLYALDTTLGLSAKSGKQELLVNMKGHVIDIAELMGTYRR